jgi:hypothetical protein
MKTNFSIVAIFLAMLVSSCGAGDNEAPAGSEITISPESLTWTGGGSVITTINPFVISVSRDGAPVTDTEVDIFLDLAPGSVVPPGVTVMVLTDENQDPLSVPARLTTDGSGTITVYVLADIGGTLEYAGNLQAFSGSSSALAPIIVELPDAP